MHLRIVGALFALLLAAACGSESQNAAGAAAGAPTPGSIAEFQSSAVGDRVFFDFDSYEVNADGRATLDRQVEWLKKYGSKYRITVEGHCDERGTREYNLALGARRASSVKSYLAARGISDASISTISYGKERPDTQGSDESAWSRNRRGVTTLQ